MEGNGSNNNFVVGPGGSIYPKVKPAAIDVDDSKVEIGNASTTPMPQMMGHPQMAAALSMGMGVGMGMGMGMNMNMNIPMLDMSARAGAPALMNPMMNMANNIPSLPVGPVIVPKMVPNLPPYVGNVESHVIQSLRRPLQEGNSKEDLIPLNRARLREDTQEGLLAVPGAKRMRLVPLQASAAAPQRTLTGRASLLYVEGDERFLSTYQCLARKQIEVFETTEEDAGANAQGRNKPIIPGQVGIRCIHCKKLPHKLRKTGSVYYPNKLDGVYQTAQKMTVGHFFKHCTMLPDQIRQKMIHARSHKNGDSGGKRYWADGVRSLGVIETAKQGLTFGLSGL